MKITEMYVTQNKYIKVIIIIIITAIIVSYKGQLILFFLDRRDSKILYD